MKIIVNWLRSPWRLTASRQILILRQGTPPDEDVIEAEETAAEGNVSTVRRRSKGSPAAIQTAVWYPL